MPCAGYSRAKGKTMKPFLETLSELSPQRFLIADGAMGTMLEACGLDAGTLPESWNLAQPQRVYQVHKAYVEAGAQLILTNTFGANALKLEKSGLRKEGKKIIEEAVGLAKKAAGDRAYVAGDVGPTGALLAPLGECSAARAYEVFAEQVIVLRDAGVDVIVLETFTQLEELRQAAKAAQDLTRIPFIASLTFQNTQKGFRTIMGARVDEAVKAMEETHACAVGSNCNLDAATMAALTKELGEKTGLPLYIKPNAGQPRLREGKTVFVQTPEDFQKAAPELARHGARIIGGCCGTTPEFIKTLTRIRAS